MSNIDTQIAVLPASNPDLSLAGADVEILAYNYDQIDEAHRQTVMDAAVDIKRNTRRVNESLIAIGKRLLEVKELLPHEMFGKWLDTEFELSQRMAQRMMSAAKVYGSNPPRVLGFSDAAIYLLAAPSMPEELRAEIETEARETGKPATRKRIENKKREYVRQRAQQQPATAHPWPKPSSNIIALDNYRAEIVIECDSGNEYTIAQRTLEDYAAGKPVDIPVEALQSIVAQWLCLVDVIDEHHEGD